MSSLYHFGIKGMKWGVRNGPPYPLGAERKSISENAANPKIVAKAQKFVNASTIRNVAIGALAGTLIVAGAAYVIKNRGLLSKTRVSDISGVASSLKVKFMDYKKGYRKNSGDVFTPLTVQAMRNRYRDCAKRMDEIIFPDGKDTLLNDEMSHEAAGWSIAEAIGERMRQASLSDDLAVFAKVLSENRVNPDITDPFRSIVSQIDDNRELFEKAIHSERDFGDLKPKEAQEVLEIVTNLAEIYRNDR